MATQNDATSLTLAEEGGGTLTLTGRALPYMPLAISGKQRAEFNWYPGNPQATVQMLGPEEQTISIKGFWKDKFIQGTGAATLSFEGRASEETFLGFSEFSTVSVGGRSVASVVELVNIVDTMRRMGRRIMLTWDKVIRYGHIVGFTQTWHTAHYCEWELEFGVMSLEEPNIESSNPNQLDLAAVATMAADWPERVSTAKFINRPFPVTLTPKLNAALTSLDAEIFRISSGIGQAAQLAAQAIQIIPNAARSVISSLAGAVSSTSLALGNLTDTALTESFAFATVTQAGSTFGLGESNALREDSLPFGIQLGAASYQRQISASYRTVRTSSAQMRFDLQRQLQNELKASFVAKQDMDLRDVSTQFYGTPNNWRDLLIYNGLTSSRLTAGQLIWVPQQGYSSGAGLTQGGAA